MSLLERLESVGAVHQDIHVVYTEGQHGDGYVKLNPVYADPLFTADVCQQLIDPFEGEFETVIAPAVGGIVLSTVAAQLASTPERKVSGVWASKTPEKDFEVVDPAFITALRGKKVLLLEDSVHTGSSVIKVRKVVEQHDGEVVGVSAVNTYGNASARTLQVPRFHSLIEVNFRVYDEVGCELCADEVPIAEDIAHGAKFKAANPNYPGGFTRIFGE